MKQKSKTGSSYKETISKAIKFVTEDMWRITTGDHTGVQEFFINILKTIVISIRRIVENDIQKKASALTYSTLLALVPMLAILFAIARGFGFENIIQSQLFDYFPSHRETLSHALEFTNAYLKQAKGGVFVGVGLIFLFWSVIVLIGNIEAVLNSIWQVKKGRSIYRKLTDYIAITIIVPVLMILSSGISIFLSTSIDNIAYLNLISPLVSRLIQFSPYLLTWLFFTSVYMLLPNTRVRFWHALPAGVLCGTAFQLFQFVYISGQIWVSTYNAVYGSFAFLPLLLLWLQLSWSICLFGAVLTFSSQNITNYNFEYDTKNISRRYKDFVILTVASIIVKRFAEGKRPLTQTEISVDYQMPISLVSQVIETLLDIGIVNEALSEVDERVLAYQPALDIGQLSVGMVLERLEKHGTENFITDDCDTEVEAWHSLLDARKLMYKEMDKLLLKEL